MLLATTAAVGDSGDLFALNVGVSKKHDDNLFKRPADGSRGALDSDNSTSTQLDLSLNKQFSLQRVAVKLGLTDTRYQTFKTLDSRNDNHSASWQWQFTPQLTGNLSATRSQAQTDFADFRGGGQNTNTTETKRLDGNWQIMGGWNLGAGASRTKSVNSQTFQQNDSSDQRIADANLTYKFTSGSSIALLTSTSRGEQLRAADPVTLRDNRFQERRSDLKLNWPITGKTTLTGGVGNVRRTHDTFSARDYSGSNGDASLNWAATAETRFTFIRSRATESWEETNSNFSIRDLTGLSASWTITPKVSVAASLNRTRLSFGGDIPGLPTNSRLDRTQTRSLGINWAPHTKIKLGASISDDRRESTLVSTDYRSKTAMLTGSIEF